MPQLKANKDLSLVDRADREAARFDLERSFAVEAGAGTGKTTLLVDRIVSLIRARRASLEQIVAITFTEKAAGELKVRLREEIEKAIPASRGAEGGALREALGDLERAPISTIHSFCASLLRERPVEAKIDPNFESLDEMGLDMLFQDTWESWLGKELELKAAPLRRALTLGMKLDPLAGLVRQIYDNRDLMPADSFPRPVYSIEDFIHRLKEGLKKTLALAPDCRKEEDKGFQNIQVLRQKLPELEAASDEQKEKLLRGLAIKGAGNKQNWKPQASCEEQKRIFDELGEELDGLRRSILADTMAGLVDWLSGFLNTMEGEKGKRGVLDFQDLLIQSKNLIRENREVRRYFQERFLYILVDEFQDTDPLQVEIVFFLAEKEARAKKWEDVEISPGKLFLVGDPKQSIYRFRRADIETYERAKERVTREGGSLTIFQNFRTVPSILTWVNRIFEPLIQPSDRGHFQPAYVPLKPHEARKEIIPGQPGIILLAPPPDYDPEATLAPQVREEEARSIAALIEEMTRSGKQGWMIFDKKERANRPVSFRDMAILFPTLSGIESYEEALKARGIPFRLEGGKEFYYRQEVRSLLSCLRALDDPGDGISLVAALRSPFFGLSDEEIFLFASSGGHLNYLRETKDGAIGEAFALLRGLHEKRNAVPISATVASLFSRTKALEFSLLRDGGEQVAANLRKILDQARPFETEKHATFRRFVEWLGSREEEGIREGESPWSEEGEENVKMLTVHKAKGLEFPIVFLANLASERNRRQEFIPLRFQGSFQVAMGEFKTQGYDAALEEERLRMDAEDRRLFYVAATRAREYLVVPLFRGKRKGFFKMLEGRLPDWDEMKPGSPINGQLVVGGGALDLEAGEKPPLRLEFGEDKKEDEDTPLQRRIQWKDAQERIKEKASRGLPLYAPSAAASASDSVPFSWDEIIEPGPGAAQGGKAFGLAFHEVMEHADLEDGSNVKTLSQMKAASQSIPEAAKNLTELCLRTIRHPLLDRLRQALRFYREVPFSVTAQEKIVEGKIDLLFEEGEGWVIVDYKTDDVEGKALEKRFDSYREQGRWYARALKKATGRMVKEVNFFFVRTGEIRVLTDPE